MIMSRLVPSFVALLLALPVAAHEFWIDVTEYRVAAGETIEARLRNGENFAGIALPYLEPRFERFDLVLGDQVTPVASRAGDNPAMNAAPLGEGLHVVAYQSSVSSLTYTDFAKFQAFVDHKDLGDARAQHAARGLSFEKFAEAYIRFPKALIAVGHGRGADQEVGLETEIFALANPYTDDVSNGLPVRLLYQGAPRANEQIEIFAQPPEGEVQVSLIRTDDKGEALIPVAPGYRYMLDAVVLRAPSAELAEARDVVWETLWATLTFAVPE